MLLGSACAVRRGESRTWLFRANISRFGSGVGAENLIRGL